MARKKIKLRPQVRSYKAKKKEKEPEEKLDAHDRQIKAAEDLLWRRHIESIKNKTKVV